APLGGRLRARARGDRLAGGGRTCMRGAAVHGGRDRVRGRTPGPCPGGVRLPRGLPRARARRGSAALRGDRLRRAATWLSRPAGEEARRAWTHACERAALDRKSGV